MPKNDSVFEIGLAMAGAISAGAYSAGVIDFLFQALDAWEKAKREAPDTVPNHSVCLRAAAGASAGSITAALAVVTVAGGLQRREFAVPQAGKQKYECVLPSLYNAWVNKPDMASPGGAPDLLSNTDLKPDEAPRSFLNAQILGELVSETLRVPPDDGTASVPAHGGRGLPYFAKRFHLFLTLANMRGVPYQISFTSGGKLAAHSMMSHGDRVHYAVEGIGVHDGENGWLSSDPAISLAVSSLPKGDQALSEQWQAYGQAALASAAFPIGLAAKSIATNTKYYDGRSWPGQAMNARHIAPIWPTAWGPDPRDFRFMSVDGGLIDNEPFEYARRSILLPSLEPNPRPDDEARGAVLMVDPFPEGPEFPPDDQEDATVLDIARALLPILKNQARFKPDELAAALDDQVFSRWLIAPTRAKTVTQDETYAIATGVLAGFGGFLDESFRAHDYQLGRRNCQRFLKKVFVVGERNPLVWDENGGRPKWSDAAFQDSRFRYLDEKKQKHFCPIIPLVGDAEPEVPEPVWPRIDGRRLDGIEKRIEARTAYVVPKLLNFKSVSPLLNWALRQAWTLFGKTTLLTFVFSTIRADLIRRNQLKGWQTYSDAAREVIAELSLSAYDYRTINGSNGLCKTLGLSEAHVRDALIEVRKRKPELIWSGQVGNQECWTLAARRPSWIKRNNPLGGQLSIG
jgi:hypothetical protein